VTRAEVRNKLKIRAATAEDADRIAALSTELGYPSSEEQVRGRLARIEKDSDHAVFVAEVENDPVIGWVHVCVSRLVENDPEGEIGGLVVDERHRGSGVGKFLMERAEQWAREKSLKSVYLRSNIIRKDAHTFYQRLGYRVLKTQYAFRKLL